MSTTRIASGRTTPGSTAWVVYGPSGIYVDVNTSSAHLNGVPVYVTSIGGTSNQWSTTGATSIYSATATGFRVYVRYADGGPLTPAVANGFQWHINWIAMEV
ncbi:MAG TPA: hypothetical protein VGC89_06150 [Pyrinomonadaceae bacterium]|jgi:hypothetical protein